MKRIFNIFTLIILSCIAFSGCMKDTQLGPEPTKGSIIRFKLTNADAEIKIVDLNIYAICPIGTDAKTLIPEFILSKGTVLVNVKEGEPMDFTNEVKVIVRGTDEIDITYTIIVTVQAPLPGFSEITDLWEVAHKDTDWPKYDVSGMGLMHDEVVVAMPNRLVFLNYLTGQKTGETENKLNFKHLTSDANGVLIAQNNVSAGGTIVIHKWDKKTEEPVEIIRYAGAKGRTYSPFNVKGDVNKDAVIYVPLSDSHITYRWTIKNGALVSQQPEELEYTFRNGDSAWGTVCGVAALGNTPEDGYIVASQDEATCMIGSDKLAFNIDEIRKPRGVKVMEFNDARYLFVWQMDYGQGGFFAAVNITDPAYITMDDAERAANGITFVPYVSPLFKHGGLTNEYSFGAMDMKVMEDGKTGIFYFMHANSGVKAYKVIAKK